VTVPADERSPEQRAYDQGQDAAQDEARLREVEAHLKAVNGSVARTADELKGVRDQLSEMVSAQRARDAVAKAMAVTVTKAAAKQVTTRQFYLGVAGFLLAVVGLYLGVK
jgi:hypothetical protein